MKIKKVLRDLVLIKPDEVKEETIGGIIIPNITVERLATGTVLGVGPGTEKVSMDSLSEGDRVLYQVNAGTEVTSGDEKCILIKYDGIFSTID